MSSDEMTSLKEHINDKFNGIEKKVDSILSTVTEDHVTLALSNKLSKDNKTSLDSLWTFARKMNIKLIYVSIGGLAVGSGGTVGISKLLGF